MAVLMDKCIDGWMHGCLLIVDELMNLWEHERMGYRCIVDGWMDGQTHVDGWMDR